MINGHMAEAKESVATIEDVEEGTFDRFAQWAYSGYYHPGDIRTASNSGSSERPILKTIYEAKKAIRRPAFDESIEEPIEASTPKESPPLSDECSGWLQHSMLKETWLKNELKESFIKRQYTAIAASIPISPPRPNYNGKEDYTQVFLSHAQLYVFAEKYDIRPLRLLALENLHNTLKIFYLYAERTGDIVQLLRYTYANTGDSSDDLRQIMTEYIGYEMDTLMKDEAFKDVMIDDGGDLLGDFLGMVGKRI